MIAVCCTVQVFYWQGKQGCDWGGKAVLSHEEARRPTECAEHWVDRVNLRIATRPHTARGRGGIPSCSHNLPAMYV